MYYFLFYYYIPRLWVLFSTRDRNIFLTLGKIKPISQFFCRFMYSRWSCVTRNEIKTVSARQTHNESKEIISRTYGFTIDARSYGIGRSHKYRAYLDAFFSTHKLARNARDRRARCIKFWLILMTVVYWPSSIFPDIFFLMLLLYIIFCHIYIFVPFIKVLWMMINRRRVTFLFFA